MGCGCPDSQIAWDDFPSPTSDWVILEEGASTGVVPYTYTTGLVSRYRTEEYGKVARIQLFITNPTTPGPLVTSTTVAQLPAGLSTGKSFYGGLAVTAGAIADNIMFPVSIDAGAVTVLCIGTKLEMDSDAAMSIDMTYPLD